MKAPAPHDPLLEDLLTGDELEPLRAASLARMLAAGRRRRRQRQVWRAAVWGVVPVLVALALLVRFIPAGKPAKAVRGVPGRAMVQAKAIEEATVSPGFPAGSSTRAGLKILTDAELLAFFPDRPVGIIGPPGRQKFVLLDGKP